MSLSVVTANLLHGRSLRDGTATAEALAEAAQSLDADIVGLQEVDYHQPRSSGVDQAGAVAEAMGAADWRFVPTLEGAEGTPERRPTQAESWPDGERNGPAYGIALLSRLPVLSWHVWRYRASRLGLPLLVAGGSGPRLGMVPDEPRAAIAAVVEGPHGPMTVATAHLSFVPGRNVGQLRALTRALSALPGPRLLFGDFNLPGPIPGWASGWDQPARTPTYPSWRPRIQFDHLLTSELNAGAPATGEAVRLPVSDHCALRLSVPLGPSGRQEHGQRD